MWGLGSNTAKDVQRDYRTDFRSVCQRASQLGKYPLILSPASLWKKLVEMMEFQLSCFKSWKVMLWKCCTQYASKFGKLSSGHRTGKGQFSFQSQRKAMPKDAQTTSQWHSSHMLIKSCSKFSKPGFSNIWTVNLQMFKLVLEKAEEPEIKLPTSAGSWKKLESSRKTSISALLTMRITVYISLQWSLPFDRKCSFEGLVTFCSKNLPTYSVSLMVI